MKARSTHSDGHGGNQEVAHARVRMGIAIRELASDLEATIEFESSKQRVARAERLLDVAADNVRNSPAALSPQNLAHFFFAVGRLARADDQVSNLLADPRAKDLLKHLMRTAARQSDSFKPCDIAQTLRGLSFLRYSGESVAQTLLARGVGLIQSIDHTELSAGPERSQFGSRDVVMILGAVGRMPQSAKRDVDSFVEAAIPFIKQHIDSFDMLDRARTTRYLRDLKQEKEALWIIQESSLDFQSAPSKALGMFTSALRDLGSEGKQSAFLLMDEIELRLAGDAEGLPPIQAGDAVRAIALLAHLRINHERYVKTFCATMEPHIKNLSLDELRETIHGLGTLRRGNERFLRQLGDVIAERLDEFDPIEIATIAWGFASTGIRHDGIRAAVPEVLAGQFQNLSPTSAAVLAWAYSLVDDDLSRRVIAECSDAAKRGMIEPTDRRQLHIAEVAVGNKPVGQCAPEIIKLAQEEIAGIPMNTFESEVYEALKGLKIPGLEIRPFEIIEGLVPDFVVSFGEKRFIVECDGYRYHFTPEGRPRGSDVIHDRIFERAGFEVIHILDREWEGRSQFEQVSLLERRLGLRARG